MQAAPFAPMGAVGTGGTGAGSGNSFASALHLSSSSAFGLHPDFTSAVAAVINKHYRWPHLIYLYDSDNGKFVIVSLHSAAELSRDLWQQWRGILMLRW